MGWTANFSTAEIEELQRRQAVRDWNVTPRRGPRAKGGSHIDLDRLLLRSE
jgi:hypothetical protein